jgi:hypothetical protein
MKRFLLIPLALIAVLWVASFAYFTMKYPSLRDPRMAELVQKHRAMLHSDTAPTPETEAAKKVVAGWGKSPEEVSKFYIEAFEPAFRPPATGLGDPAIAASSIHAAARAQAPMFSDIVSRTRDLGSVLKVLESPANHGCARLDEGGETRCDQVRDLVLTTWKVAVAHLLQAALAGDSVAFDDLRRSLGRIDDVMVQRSFELVDRMMIGHIRSSTVVALGTVYRSAPLAKMRAGARESLAALNLAEPSTMSDAIEHELVMGSTMAIDAIERAHRPFGADSVLGSLQVSGDYGFLSLARWAEEIGSATGVLRHSLNLADTEAQTLVLLEALRADIEAFEKSRAPSSAPEAPFETRLFSAKLGELQALHEAKQPYERNYIGEILQLIAVPNYSKFVDRFFESRKRNLELRVWLLGPA